MSEALRVWFAPSRSWGVRELVGNVRAVVRRRALELDDVAACSSLLSSPPMMLGDSFASVSLDFVYFGAAESMPWPVLDAVGEWRPIDCVWALDLVGCAVGP